VSCGSPRHSNSHLQLRSDDSILSQKRTDSPGCDFSDRETSDSKKPECLILVDSNRDPIRQPTKRRSGSLDGYSHKKSISSFENRKRFSLSIIMDAVADLRRENRMAMSIFTLNPMLRDCSSYYIPLPMTQVLPTLFIGNHNNASNEEALKQKGITHILTLISYQTRFSWAKQLQCPMHDGGRSNIKDVLDKVYDFMVEGQKGNNKLLVHCHCGQNRSAVVIILFLMKNAGKILFRAHRDLKQLRPIVQVNVEYAKQLLEFERELFGKTSLPPEWMERESNEEEDNVTFKYEDLNTHRHGHLSESSWNRNI